RAPRRRSPRRPHGPFRAELPAPGLPAGRTPGPHRPAKRRAAMHTVTVEAVNRRTADPAQVPAHDGVSADDVLAVARADARVELAPSTVDALARSRSIVEEIELSQKPVYGISTGFGALAGTCIAPERRAELQHALTRSHAAGVRAPVSREAAPATRLP